MLINSKIAVFNMMHVPKVLNRHAPALTLTVSFIKSNFLLYWTLSKNVSCIILGLGIEK